MNGKIETSAKMQIDENQDEIWVNNRVLVYERFVYYLLNKPKGVISATEDDKHRTVLDLLDENARQKKSFQLDDLILILTDFCY